MASKTKGTKTDDGEVSTLFVGIDLGTSKTAIVSSNGIKKSLPSVVGWPKDIVSRKFLGRDILFGDEALTNRLSLRLSRPMEKGIVKDTEEDRKAAAALIGHAVEIARDGKEYQRVLAIIGAPAQTDHINKTTLIEISKGVADSTMVVSEPFAVSYAVERMNHSLIVDMGAGTIDLCRMHATLPEQGDEVSLHKAGDHIDLRLLDLVQQRYKGAALTPHMVQRWKEEHGFVGAAKHKVEVDVPLEGKDTVVDITDIIRESCESIIDDLVNAIKGLISSYDPEFQPLVKRNIVLAGRLSGIDGLPELLMKKLSSLGEVEVHAVDEAEYCGAKGALMLSRDIPMDHWDRLTVE